jgi:hypothetical protein
VAGATDAYNKAVASLETRVLVTARKFKDLGTTGVDDEIEELAPVEVTPRLLQASELGGTGSQSCRGCAAGWWRRTGPSRPYAASRKAVQYRTTAIHPPTERRSISRRTICPFGISPTIRRETTWP